MVHFGAKITNTVHYHWFSEGYSEKSDLGSIKCFVAISVGVEPVKPPHNYGLG